MKTKTFLSAKRKFFLENKIIWENPPTKNFDAFPLTGKLLSNFNTKTGAALSTPLLLPAAILDTYRLGIMGIIKGGKEIFPHLGSRISKATTGTKNLAKEGVSRAWEFGFNVPWQTAVKPGVMLVADSVRNSVYGISHLPADILTTVTSRPLHAISAGCRSAIGTIAGIPGILGWGKAKQFSDNMLASAGDHWGQAVGNYNFTAALGKQWDATKSAVTYSASSMAKAYPNLVLGRGNFISNAIDRGAQTLATAPSPWSTIISTRERFMQSPSASQGLFAQAQAA